MKKIYSVLVENRSGVLCKVAGLFSRRCFNIDSLAVGVTADPTVSRITIIVDSGNSVVEQVEKQLNKLVPVIKVRSLSQDAVRAELMLVKVGCEAQDLAGINQIAALMKAQVADVAKGSVTLRFTGDHSQCDTLCELLRPYGIREIARTGAIALERG